MKFTEYYHSALRHLETCQLMFEKLSTIDNNKPLFAKKQRLKLDIYYLSGYIVETMLSYAFFANIKWNKNVDIDKCSLYTKDFKTHKLEFPFRLSGNVFRAKPLSAYRIYRFPRKSLFG